MKTTSAPAIPAAYSVVNSRLWLAVASRSCR